MCASCEEAVEGAIEQVQNEHCGDASEQVEALRAMRNRLDEEIRDVLGQTGRDGDEDSEEEEEDGDGE